MIDLREKIRKIIEKELESKHFVAVDLEKSVELIYQILQNYEKLDMINKDENDNLVNEKKNAELIFVAAPTGAGKDSLVARLNYQNKEKKYIELNMDIFRHYFPLFIENLEKITDKNFALETNEFSYEIYATIQEVLLQEFPGTNIIITGTLRETDWVEQVFERFKSDEKTNYKVKLVCLAVPKKESAISIIQRYIGIIDTQLERLSRYPGTARYTTMKYHDETFERFPKNFEYFQKKFIDNPGELIDDIEVYTRSKDLRDLSEETRIYSSEKDTERTALDAINELRNNDYKVSYEIFSLIASRIIKNKEYLKSQGTLREIVKDLAVILNYPKVVEKLEKIPADFDEINLD